MNDLHFTHTYKLIFPRTFHLSKEHTNIRTHVHTYLHTFVHIFIHIYIHIQDGEFRGPFCQWALSQGIYPLTLASFAATLSGGKKFEGGGEKFGEVDIFGKSSVGRRIGEGDGAGGDEGY